MAFSDYLAKRRALVHGGRRFVCHPPNLLTLWALRVLFYGRFAEVQAAAEESVEKATELGLSIFLASPRAAAEVLETCCEVHGGGPGEVEELAGADRELLVALTGAVISICNVARLARSQKAPDRPVGLPAEGEPDDLEVQIVAIAERLGVLPTEVAALPFETLLSLPEALSDADRLQPARPFVQVAAPDSWKRRRRRAIHASEIASGLPRPRRVTPVRTRRA